MKTVIINLILNLREIGFVDEFIDLPLKDSIKINLFKEEIPFKSFYKPFLETENRIGFGF